MAKENKRRGFIGKLQDFMSSYSGKVILNYAYSWGAAVVILGSLFKLTHLPGANVMLFIGMGTEVLVFLVSAFDKPYKSYKWESVFPKIKLNGAPDSDDNNEDAAGDEQTVASVAGTVSADELNAAMAAAQSAAAAAQAAAGSTGGQMSAGGVPFGGTAFPGGGYAGSPVPGNGNAVTGNAVGGAAAQTGQGGVVVSGPVVIGGGGTGVPQTTVDQETIDDMNNATEKYVQQLKEMTESLERFQQSTTSLADVSDALAASYKIISDNSGNITANSQGYVYQMENLNRNLSGLNTIYEIQLHSISSQLDTIKQVNEGLTRIKDMYENSKDDSEKFHRETELMAKQIEELNAVYARMLQAMTVNMK